MSTNNADNFNNPIRVSTGGTGVASLIAYEPLFGGTTSTNPIQQAGTGFSTSGFVLTSKGSSALPIFSSASPAWVKLSAQTVSSVTNVNFTSTFITSTYTTYVVIYQKLVLASGSNLAIQVSTNNGGALIGSGYMGGLNSHAYNSATLTNINASVACFGGPSGAGTESSSGQIFFSIPASAKFSLVGKSMLSGTSGVFGKFFGNNSTTTTVNYIRFISSAGTVSGTFTLYGIKS